MRTLQEWMAHRDYKTTLILGEVDCLECSRLAHETVRIAAALAVRCQAYDRLDCLP